MVTTRAKTTFFRKKLKLRLWKPELSLDVEEYVGLALGDRVRVGLAHGGIVKVVPVIVLGAERSVMPRSSPIYDNKH